MENMYKRWTKELQRVKVAAEDHTPGRMDYGFCMLLYLSILDKYVTILKGRLECNSKEFQIIPFFKIHLPSNNFWFMKLFVKSTFKDFSV